MQFTKAKTIKYAWATYTAWVGLMVKKMCFLLRGCKFKSRGGVGYVDLRRLYQSNRWAEGVSYTNLVSGLAVTLKIDCYYYYYPIETVKQRTNPYMAVHMIITFTVKIEWLHWHNHERERETLQCTVWILEPPEQISWTSYLVDTHQIPILVLVDDAPNHLSPCWY